MPTERSINIFEGSPGSDPADKLEQVLEEMARRAAAPNPITDSLGHAANFDIFDVVPVQVVDPETFDGMFTPKDEFRGFN